MQSVDQEQQETNEDVQDDEDIFAPTSAKSAKRKVSEIHLIFLFLMLNKNSFYMTFDSYGIINAALQPVQTSSY